jgi:hypothetical protein
MGKRLSTTEVYQLLVITVLEINCLPNTKVSKVRKLGFNQLRQATQRGFPSNGFANAG